MKQFLFPKTLGIAAAVAIAVTVQLTTMAAPARAALITQLSAGPGNTIIDSDQGLSWLKLDQTIAQSVQSLINTPIPGFTVATESQVLQLFNGLVNANLSAFVGLFGDTAPSLSRIDVFGLYPVVGGVDAGGGSLDPVNTFFNILAPSLFSSPAPLTANVGNAGVFLVQVQVPEPSTLAIFAFGLAGLGLMGWRRWKLESQQEQGSGALSWAHDSRGNAPTERSDFAVGC